MKSIERLHYSQLKAALMEICLRASVLNGHQVCECLREVLNELLEDWKDA